MRILMATLAVCCALVGAAEEPELVFGVMSDMHVTDAASAEWVARALRYFRGCGVDAVVMAGDMVDNGLDGEFALVADAWQRAFPDDRGENGARVEKLFVYGNHDAQCWRQEWADGGDPSLNRRKETFERFFREPWSPCWIKDVKGYKFVGCDYQYRADRQRRVERIGEPSLKDFMESHRGDLAGRRPFFFIQHMHPKGTCSAPWTWGQDDGTSTAVLRTFPNCIAFSGHSHTPLNDERTLWCGDFTSVGTAALGFLIPFGGRENSEIDGEPDTKDQLLPRLRPADGKHALVVRVYADRVSIERRDMANGLPLGEDWVVDTSSPDGHFRRRGGIAAVPRFAEGSRVTVSEVTETQNRRGEPVRARKVTFPNRCSPRAFDYEVTLEMCEVDVVRPLKVKRVYSGGFYRAEPADDAEVVCPFAESDFPAPNSPRLDIAERGRRWRFAVRPCDSFGNRGEAVYSDFVPAE